MWTSKNRGRYDRRRLRYPSDLTDEEWALVEPLIPRARRGGNRRTVNVREVVNGLMYVLESVREHHAGLHSFRSMRRMEARRRKASALWLRHSQSLASRRQRPSQANVRSTIQRFGSATKPVA